MLVLTDSLPSPGLMSSCLATLNLMERSFFQALLPSVDVFLISSVSYPLFGELLKGKVHLVVP